MKEIEYLKKRGVVLRNPQTITWDDGLKIFNQSLVIDPIGDKRKITIETISKNDDFDLYTSTFISSDSTLAFDYDNIADCMARIICGCTYDKTRFTAEQLANAKEVIYQVGEIVSDGYYDENEKSWRKWKHSVFIPYKMEIIE